MEFSSLVLMEREKETNFLVREIGSYSVSDGAEYIKKLFYDGEHVNVVFDTNKDVEEWEYSAIFDLFNETVFLEKGYKIETDDDQYNPTWIVKLPYLEEHKEMENKLEKVCSLIKENIEKAFEDIKGKEDQYR